MCHSASSHQLRVPIWRLRSIASALLAAAFLVPLSTTASHAQEEKLESKHGDWDVKCAKPAGSKNRICWAEQKVTSEDRPNVGLTVTYLKPKKKDEGGTLQIQAPLGVVLQRRLGLKVDGKDVGNVPFERCIASGCWARSQMPAELLKIFTTGKSAVFIIFDTPESGIGIPISLNGLSPAIAALDKLN